MKQKEKRVKRPFERRDYQSISTKKSKHFPNIKKYGVTSSRSDDTLNFGCKNNLFLGATMSATEEAIDREVKVVKIILDTNDVQTKAEWRNAKKHRQEQLSGLIEDLPTEDQEAFQYIADREITQKLEEIIGHFQSKTK